MFNEKSRNAAVICAYSPRRNQSVCKLRFLSDLHKVLMRSDAGVESAHVTLCCVETVGAQECRLDHSREALQLYWEVQG